MSTVTCVFCGLLAGEGRATWVARRDAASAFLPLDDGWLDDVRASLTA